MSCTIPKEALESFARAILPDIIAFYETEEGNLQYEEWLKSEEGQKRKASAKSQRFCGCRGHLRNFWQYWVQSLSVHSEHFSAALECSQKRSGYIRMHSSHTDQARKAATRRETA